MGKRLHEASLSLSAHTTTSSASSRSDTGDEALYPCKVSAVSASPARERPVMQCSLPPHHEAMSFASIDAFEAHYAKEHSNRCASCHKNFPSAHLLALHLDEHHNPLREEREAKGEKTYGCFVEGCDKLCSSPQKRRLHLIDKHAFPRVYNFRVTEAGIDKSTSMLLREPAGRRRLSTLESPADAATKHRHRSSQQTPHVLSASNELDRPLNMIKPGLKPSTRPGSGTTTMAAPATPTAPLETPDSVDELEQSMAALRFVPPSVTRHQGRKTRE
ncbi:hypothetical protein DV736_g137, partial [Chaetothyriales sp. CBS 134916]